MGLWHLSKHFTTEKCEVTVINHHAKFTEDCFSFSNISMEITKTAEAKDFVTQELINIYRSMPFLILCILRNVTLLDIPFAESCQTSNLKQRAALELKELHA